MGFSVVSIDLDGTLVPGTTTFFFLSKKLGFYAEMMHLEERFRRGELSFEQCIAKQFGLMKGIRLSEAHRIMDELPRIQNIAEGVEELKKKGLRVILLTDNPDVLANYFVKFGFERAIGSDAGVEDGCLTGELNPLSDKSEGLAHFLAENSLGFDECVHVGDWLNDIPVFRKVGYSIALNARDIRVKDSANYSMNTMSLLDVAEHIMKLV